jgi:ABC-type multidrug transport system ATPase subunit
MVINKLGDADIVRKIISLLAQQRYGSIITILHNMEDLSTMTPIIVIGKIAAFEMSRKMGRQEEPTSFRPYARKGKKKAPLQVSQVKKRKKKTVMIVKIINHQHHPPRTKKQSDVSER